MPMFFAWQSGDQFQAAGVVEAVMVVRQDGIHRGLGDHPLPQFHRIDPGADRADVAFLLERQRVPGKPSAKALSVLCEALVFEVVEVDDVDVIDAEALHAFLKSGADAGCGVV